MDKHIKKHTRGFGCSTAFFRFMDVESDADCAQFPSATKIAPCRPCAIHIHTTRTQSTLYRIIEEMRETRATNNYDDVAREMFS